MPMDEYMKAVYAEYGVEARGVREARKAVAALIEAEVEATPLPEGEEAIAAYKASKAELGQATRVWRKARGKRLQIQQDLAVAKAVEEKSNIERYRAKARNEAQKENAKAHGLVTRKPGTAPAPAPAKPSKASHKVLKSFSALCA